MARCVCAKLQIKLIRLSKPKARQDFNGIQVFDITYAIYPIMTVQRHRKMITPMLITKLGQYSIILKNLE